MASIFHQIGKNRIAAQLLNMETSTALKAMLVDDTYVDSATRDLVDDGTADDPASHEIAVSGYTGGFAGAGRKSVNAATPAWVRDDPNLRIEYDFADIAYGNLGTGVTIGMVVVIEEITSDALSNIIYADDLTANVPTNGGPITYVPDVEGMLQL